MSNAVQQSYYEAEGKRHKTAVQEIRSRAIKARTELNKQLDEARSSEDYKASIQGFETRFAQQETGRLAANMIVWLITFITRTTSDRNIAAEYESR